MTTALDLTHRLAVVCHGTPIPQGSKTASVIKGRAVIRDANAKKLKPWRAALTAAAVDAALYHDPFVGPVTVWAWFTFTRPANHHIGNRTANPVRDNAPAGPCSRTYGDLDKLLRAALDSLTGAKTIYGDDAQVTSTHAHKVYAGEHPNALARPGVALIIEGATT